MRISTWDLLGINLVRIIAPCGERLYLG